MSENRQGFYIYELVDPRDQKPFYIGKGKGKRLNVHETEARSGAYSRKCDRIRAIWAEGKQVEKRIIKRFAKESDAYQAEKELIAEIGLCNLTNVLPGGVPQKPESVRNWTLASLEAMTPHLARCLRELAKFGNLFVANVDVTAGFKSLVQSLIKDCGKDAVRDAVKPYGVDLQIA